tara:strand:+ start:838 stop:1392 length:555 start_codon:yes stop_codon:yes gene_type:complete
MSFTPSTFKSNIAYAGGGARPSLYKVKINFGQSSTNSVSFSSSQTLLVKAASLPASNIAPLPINYAGRAYKWSGFRTYDNWTITVINDEDFSIRNQMTQWMRWLGGELNGERNIAFGDPSDDGYWQDGEGIVQQVGTDGSEVGPEYKLSNLWPTELGEIAVDWSSDAIQEYTIGFAYDHWTSSI